MLEKISGNFIKLHVFLHKGCPLNFEPELVARHASSDGPICVHLCNKGPCCRYGVKTIW